ncbi:MAG TPA: hypothetical protein VL523_04195 [Terriglobia bacterium]|nr:hypothetical protein [Terriglobia bacterium]
MSSIKQQGTVCWVAALAALALGCLVGPGSRKSFAADTPGAQAAQPSEEQIDMARGSLDRFLDSHPEIQGDVVGDPGHISDPNYIQAHPALQAFLESHPLIKADPRAYLSPESWRFQYRRSDTDDLLSYVVPFGVFICCLLALLWVLRTVLENRRWNRSFKVHEEVHAKLIEKFSSGQDLTAYMTSDAGKRLLEWAPPSIDSGSRSMPAAVARILWSMVAGLLLGFGGLGLLAIRGTFADLAEPLLVFGTLGLTLGVGFILSAIISYALSKHLGLIGNSGPGGAQGMTKFGPA